MFAGLIDQAKAAVTRLLLEYVARASVAVPFVIALGFGLAAITLMLVQHFGHTTAYWTMAGGLISIGVIAAIAVHVKENEAVAEEQAEHTHGNTVLSGATTEALLQAPMALLGAASAIPGGATTILKGARIISRHYPLVLLAGLIGLLFWPTPAQAEDAVAEAEQGPDGLQPSQTWH